MTPILCPACDGPSMSAHPAGALGGWTHGPTCLIGAHEDGQAVADSEVLADRDAFTRAATESERVLLGTLGFLGADMDGLVTFVSAVTPGVRYRGWPQLRPPVTPTEG